MPDGWYSVSDNQDYFEYVMNKYETIVNNFPVQIFANKIKNRLVFKLRRDYKIELLSPETMELLGTTKKDIDQDKDGEDVWKIRIYGSCISAL